MESQRPNRLYFILLILAIIFIVGSVVSYLNSKKERTREPHPLSFVKNIPDATTSTTLKVDLPDVRVVGDN